MEVNNFKLISALNAYDRIIVRKYRSTKTGLTVALGYVPGPIVNGFFILPTEAHDDDGLPHTLEHLIFLGSEDYPYKGVLDLLANRNLASGTNAWTDTDHTCYTMTTSGSEGFLNLMPVYIDHILYPTLTDAGFETEVHHISGEGKDAGVVYCEMQGSENSGESRVHLEMLRAVYPGHCGYKSETGGLLKNLRESTDNEKVRKYHKDYYRPENLTLIIVGQVEDEEVLNALSGVEAKILSKGERPAFERPWQNPIPPLTKSVDIVVPYSADEEDNGMVYMGWRGPSCVDQLYEMHACAMLLRYLSDTSISPLQLEFVEIADPLASSVSYSLIENSISLLYLMFDNVPISKLSEIKPRLDAKLRAISSGAEKLDITRLQCVINRQKLETLLNLETQPHKSIAFNFIGDALYGTTERHLDQRMNPIKDLDKMAAEGASFWLKLLDIYLINAPSVTARGKPSIAEKTKLALEEEMRISEQVEKLGTEGLKEKSQKLTDAIAVNERPPPTEMLCSRPVPDPSKIHFHKIETYSTNSLKAPLGFDLNDLPLYTDIHGASTNFVYLMVLMDTSVLTDELRMYLPLYLDSVLESPIIRNGDLIPHQTVVGELERDTISATTSLGINNSSHFSCGQYGQTATLVLQVEPSKYEKGVQWLHELLYCIEFDPERLSIIAAKMINEVAEFRRNGSKVARDVLKDLNYTKACNESIVNMVRQHQFLSKVGKELFSEGTSAEHISKMKELRELVTRPSNMSLRIALNLETITTQVPDLNAPWKSFLPDGVAPLQQKLKITRDYELLDSNVSKMQARVLGLGCVESAYLFQSVPCINDYNHPDLPALYVFLQYLTQLEGPMWKQIRGLGLSYGYNMIPYPNEGLLYFYFSRSTNVLAAYKEAKKIVDSHLQEGSTFDPVLLDSAKSSMMFEIINLEGTVSYAIIQSVFADFKGVSGLFNRELVRRFASVTIEELKKVGLKYVKPLFDPSKAKTSIVTHSSKVEEIGKGFKELGLQVKIVPSLNEVFL